MSLQCGSNISTYIVVRHQLVASPENARGSQYAGVQALLRHGLQHGQLGRVLGCSVQVNVGVRVRLGLIHTLQHHIAAAQHHSRA